MYGLPPTLQLANEPQVDALLRPPLQPPHLEGQLDGNLGRFGAQPEGVLVGVPGQGGGAVEPSGAAWGWRPASCRKPCFVLRFVQGETQVAAIHSLPEGRHVPPGLAHEPHGRALRICACAHAMWVGLAKARNGVHACCMQTQIGEPLQCVHACMQARVRVCLRALRKAFCLRARFCASACT